MGAVAAAGQGRQVKPRRVMALRTSPGADITAVLADDDLADLLGGVVASSDDDALTGDRLGSDALRRFHHAALGQLEREVGDDTAHDASRETTRRGRVG
ncbi:hypothetical protein GCM10027075_72600 [Streptomyces heilongjiangensis]